MDKLDKVFYINLKHREDRREQMENEFINKFLYTRAERSIAVFHKVPEAGCAISHIKLWRRMLKENWNAIMILEDDAMLQTTRDEIDMYINAFLDDPNADLLSISNSCGHYVEYNHLFNRGFNSQTASCYVLKKDTVPKLIKYYFNNEHDAYNLDETDPNLATKIGTLDISWEEFQKKYNFLIPKHEKIVIQRPSYSDIQHKTVFYNV